MMICILYSRIYVKFKIKKIPININYLPYKFLFHLASTNASEITTIVEIT